MNYLGIDPGKSGAFALLDFQGKMIALYDMPSDLVQIVSLVELLLEQSPNGMRAAIEKPFVGDRMGKPSILSFGMSIGDLRGVMAAFKIPFVMVAPQDWQTPFGVTGKSKGKDSIGQCLKLYPTAPLIVNGKRFDGRSDALLIDRWLWRQETARS
jgi:hypothetical protein